MGKGARNRVFEKHQAEKQEAIARLLSADKRYHRLSCVLAVLSFLLTAVTMIVQGFAIASINASKQTEDVAAVLSTAVPTGITAIVLMSVGSLIAAFLLCARCPKLSSIGVALLLIGAVCLGFFIAALAECFPFREIITGTTVREVGLNFNKLFFRHGIAFFPPLLLFAAQGVGFAAAKKRELADLMTPAKGTVTDPASSV